MRLSLGRGAGARPSAARHRGGAWSAAALPSAPLLPLARTGAVAAPPAWVGALELSETVLDESAVPSYGAHAALAAHQASRPQSFMRHLRQFARVPGPVRLWYGSQGDAVVR